MMNDGSCWHASALSALVIQSFVFEGAALSTTEGGTEKKEEKKATECVGTSERSNTSSAATTPYASSPRGAGAVGASISLEQFSQQHHLRLDIVTEEPLPPPPNKKKSPQQQQKKKKLHTDDTSAQGDHFSRAFHHK